MWMFKQVNRAVRYKSKNRMGKSVMSNRISNCPVNWELCNINKELEINRGENIVGGSVHTSVASGRLMGGKDSADKEIKGVKFWKCFYANARSLVSLDKKQNWNYALKKKSLT